MDLKIDPEFADKIPPLTPEELEQLEANILEEGAVINPLIIWNGVIVDGHNRYRILQKHPEITFHVYEKEFSDRYEVIAWICKNQLGRRNLTETQKKFLVGKQYEAEKAMRGGSQFRDRDKETGQFTSMGQNVPLRPERTSARIAKEIGKNERYVRRAEEFAQGLDAAEEIEPGIKQQIFSGEIRPSDKDVAAIARASPEERKELVDALRAPRPSSRGHPENDNNDDDEPGAEDCEEESDEDAAPFIPSKASIRKISEAMASSPDRPSCEMSAEFIIEELDDALESMIYRWDFCLRENSKEAAEKDCCRRIQELVEKGKAYLKLYRGGKKQNET